MKLYYRLLASRIKRSLRMEENWSGGPSSLMKAVSAGKIGPETKAELYVHPVIADGMLMNQYMRKREPLEEELRTVAQYGQVKYSE